MKNLNRLNCLIVILLSITFSCQKTQKQDEDFEDFYSKFTSDSVFQISRIKFPLKGILLNGETVGFDKNGKDYKGVYTWNVTSWHMHHSVYNIDKNEYKVEIKNLGDTVRVGVYGIDFGYSHEQSYVKSNHKWYLVYLHEVNL